jgi:hypothetical protein
LLEYLQHIALRDNFICSKIVISKETPLFDSAKFFRAAAENAVVPGKRGAAIPLVATTLDFRSEAYGSLHEWVNRPDAEVCSHFAATLFLFQRVSNNPEISDRIVRFWSGEKLGLSEIKKWLWAAPVFCTS